MKRLQIDQNTGLALVGITSLAIGLALVFIPAAFVAVGILLITYAILPDHASTP